MKIKRIYRVYLSGVRYNMDTGQLEQESVDIEVEGGLKELEEAWHIAYGSEFRYKWQLIKEERIND